MKCPIIFFKNAHKTKIVAKKNFPEEKWDFATSLKLKYEGFESELYSITKNIKVARSRFSGNKGEEKILAKEIAQAKILSNNFAYIFLLPKLKSIDGKFIKGPDAIVNGTFFEFKTITGPINKVERHFRQSREQCENVFLRIIDPKISKDAVVSKIRQILNDKTYKGGTTGRLLFYLEGSRKLHFLQIEDIK